MKVAFDLLTYSSYEPFDLILLEVLWGSKKYEINKEEDILLLEQDGNKKVGERLLVWEILHNFVLLYNCKVR